MCSSEILIRMEWPGIYVIYIPPGLHQDWRKGAKIDDIIALVETSLFICDLDLVLDVTRIRCICTRHIYIDICWNLLEKATWSRQEFIVQARCFTQVLWHYICEYVLLSKILFWPVNLIYVRNCCICQLYVERNLLPFPTFSASRSTWIHILDSIVWYRNGWLTSTSR